MECRHILCYHNPVGITRRPYRGPGWRGGGRLCNIVFCDWEIRAEGFLMAVGMHIKPHTHVAHRGGRGKQGDVEARREYYGNEWISGALHAHTMPYIPQGICRFLARESIGGMKKWWQLSPQGHYIWLNLSFLHNSLYSIVHHYPPSPKVRFEEKKAEDRRKENWIGSAGGGKSAVWTAFHYG